MFEKLTLRNFQAHKDLSVDLEPGVNVIIGPSDRGKSSLIRALQLIFFNRPGGTSFITHGEDTCTVEVDLKDGPAIRRTRGKTKNEYQIGDKAPLKAPGRDVPEEVLAICPMKEINFQGQHDSPFMLSETAGEVGRMLNKMVDLTVIDRALNKLNSDKKNTSNTLSYESETLEDLQEEAKHYEDVALMEADVETLEEMASIYREISEKVEEVEEAIEAVEDLAEELRKLPETSMANNEIVALTNMAKEELALEDHLEELGTCYRLTANILRDLGDMEEAEKALEQELDEIVGEVCPLCNRPMGEKDA